MSIEYKVNRVSLPGFEEEQEVLYPSVVTRGTVGVKEWAEYASMRSTLSEPDVMAAMSSLSDFISHSLKMGYNVNLEKIGFLSVKLDTEAELTCEKSRGVAVKADGVRFKCAKELKEELATSKLIKAEAGKRTSGTTTFDERKDVLLGYLVENQSISARKYKALTACTKYQLHTDLEQYIAEGLLLRKGKGRATRYYLIKQE
ncbi:MAG TPA: hypothetical protein DCF91_05545 [Porphyromonadaceae bacterium]|nr:hypothetical protein [Porphyromonadaceae bacterium]